jgi:hypothetical protein
MTEKISNDDWRLVIERVSMMPSHIKMIIGGYGSFSREVLLEHLEKRDDIGKRIVEMQLNYLKFFKTQMQSVANE